MGISHQLFIIRIGNFHSSKVKENKYITPENEMEIVWPKKCPTLILILSLAILIGNQNYKFSNLQQTKPNVFQTANLVDLIITESSKHLCMNTLSWANHGISTNKLQKMINGNRRNVGYKLAVWNCGRGLIQDGFSVKLNEIKQFIETRKPHCFGIIESDLYSPNSQVNRTKKYTTDEIREKLNIDGYKIEFPKTWDIHGQARIICYVSDDIKYSRKHFDNNFDDIPSISLEIGLGRATRTSVHFYYREWKNGVTGESDVNSQLVNLKKHIKQWVEIVATGRSFVALGDANLCAKTWNDPDFKYKDMANEVQNFLLQDSCSQLVNKFTRVQKVGDTLQKSCLDHVTTNVPEKCKVPEVFSCGSSDHLPVMVTKYSREPKSQPQFIKKRNYKNFNNVNFLNDVNKHLLDGSFDRVLSNNNTDEASALFSGIFGSILNRHAPLKVFQVRNNYIPWLSDQTKQMIKARDELQEEAIAEDCIEKFEAYKRLRNRVNSRLEQDEIDHYKTKFYQEDPSISTQWRNVNDYLNTSNKSYSNTPNIITHNGQTYTKPRDIANAINDTFLKKVKDLRDQVSAAPEIDPKERLRKFLESKSDDIPLFEIKKITKQTLWKLLKKRKGNKSSGIDYIDGYSVKLAAPLIDDILHHLVNLTIENSEYPSLWKINKVSPRFKKGDKTKGENWRPVTDIVFVSKLAEAAVFEHVAEHFLANNLWHPNQFQTESFHSNSYCSPS